MQKGDSKQKPNGLGVIVATSSTRLTSIFSGHAVPLCPWLWPGGVEQTLLGAAEQAGRAKGTSAWT